jgi:catechol 2,3-dioxygenase-like lactoylglutathione lyase family enzyme
MPVRTHGLTHFAIAARDPQISLRFYQAVLGVVPVYEDDAFVQAQTPDSRDVLVFERNPRSAGKPGGVAHFGFRLKRARDIDRAREAVRAAGGTITDSGEFIPGEPYVFFRDPDGYEVEIWYEIPTSVDPPTTPIDWPEEVAGRVPSTGSLITLTVLVVPFTAPGYELPPVAGAIDIRMWV